MACSFAVAKAMAFAKSAGRGRRCGVLLAPLLLVGLFSTATAQCPSAAVHLATTLNIPSSGVEVLLTGDVNNDGKPDLVLIRSPDAFQIALGDGRGQFTLLAPEVTTAINGAAIGDLNTDGKLDLVLTTPTGLRSYLGRGDGTFSLYTLPTMPPVLGSPNPQPVDVVLGDVDSDGSLDAVVADYASKTLRVLFGRPDGFLGARSSVIQVDGMATGLTVFREVSPGGSGGPVVAYTALGHQSNPDVFGLLVFAPRLSSGWRFHATVPMLHGPFKLAVGDLNRDGRPEVVVSEHGDGYITVLSSPSWAIQQSMPVSPRPGHIALADLNADGFPDLVSTSLTGETSVLLGHGNSTFQAPAVIGRGAWPTAIAVADFNRDGALDLAIVDKGADRVQIYVNDCVIAPADLSIGSIEVVQTVQDLGQSVPLVARKRTFARVHIASNVPALDLDARLWRVDVAGKRISDELLPMNLGGVIALPVRPNRQSLDDSFVFELPADWLSSGELRVSAEVNRLRRVQEPNVANNRVDNVALQLKYVKPLPVTFVHLTWRSNGKTVSAPQSELDLAQSELVRKLPVPSLDLIVKEQDFNFDDMGLTFGNPADFSTEINNWNRTFEPDQNRLYYFFLNAGSTGIAGGAAARGTPPWRVAAGNASVVAHEFGHLLGLEHVQADHDASGVVCQFAGNVMPYPYRDGIIGGPPADEARFVGFDAGAYAGESGAWARTRVVGSETREEISYCNKRWFSDVSVRAMLADIDRRFAWHPTPPVLLAQTDGLPPRLSDQIKPGYIRGDFLSVFGAVEPNSGKLLRWRALRVDQIGTIPDQPRTDYLVRLVDMNGNALATHTVTLESVFDQSLASFHVVVPFAPGTTRIELLPADASRVVAAQTVSRHAPRVDRVRMSSVGSASQLQYLLSWRGSDVDGDKLTYTLLYSADAKRTWQVILFNLHPSTYRFSARRLPGTRGRPTGFFRVIATDGVLTGLADTAPITVPDKPAVLTMLAPFPEAAFAAGQLVTLQVSASGLVRLPEESSSIVWRSDRDGVVGIGSLAHFTPRAEGAHVISVTLMDDNGRATVAQRRIFVRRPGTADAIVQCVDRRGRIAAVGGHDGVGTAWRRATAGVASDIISGKRYVVPVRQGSLHTIAVVRPRGRSPYLRAPADASIANNLLTLPSCKSEAASP